MPQPPTRSEAGKRISALADWGNIIPTRHWRERAEERGFDDADGYSVIENGLVASDGIWSAEHGHWHWVMDGPDVDGRKLRIVVAYSDSPESLDLWLITGMRRERGRWQPE